MSSLSQNNIEDFQVGTKVKTLVSWPYVPQGTEGYVCEDYGTGITIGWDLENRPYPKDMEHSAVGQMWAIDNRCPLRDGFDKETELDYLEIVK